MAIDSYEELFRESYPRLVALGTSMSGDREVARELAQETMLRAHRRWDEVSEYQHPGAWLRRVMSNLLIDRHRSRTSERRAVERLSSAASTQLSTGDRDAFADGIEAQDRWTDLLAPLTVQQRMIATLFYGEDASIESVALSLDMSPGAVKSALFKIRRALKRRLEAHDV